MLYLISLFDVGGKYVMNTFKAGMIYQLQTMPVANQDEKYVCVVKTTENSIDYFSLKNPGYIRVPTFVFIEFDPKEITEWLN